MRANELPRSELFYRKDSAVTSAVLLYVGGGVAFAFAVAGLALALYARLDQFALHALTTLPILCGISAITAAVVLGNAPREVAVRPDDICIKGRRTVRCIPFAELGWASVATTMGHKRTLVLYDRKGKATARIGDAFDDFDELADLVIARVRESAGALADQVQAKKARKSALFMALGGVGAILLGAVVAYGSYREQRAAQLLVERGVPGHATVVRHFLAPNGVTPRLEYRIDTPAHGSATRNAEVVRPVWNALANVKHVNVIYVPDEPAISRLALGEPEETDFSKQPMVMFILSAVVAVMGLVFLGAAWMQARGLDIDLDSKTGKLSVKRFGDGR